VNRLAHPAGLEILAVPQATSVSPLQDQRPFKLRRRTQHLQQEPGGRVALVTIQTLGHRNEPIPYGPKTQMWPM
jgi:hypothetical protein